MTTYHIHHIIPRHMGGTDDQSNLIKLTVEEHAEAHRVLFEQHGRKEDYLAWKGLAGLIDKDEIVRQLMSLTHKGKKLSDRQKEQNSIRMLKMIESGDHIFLSEKLRNNTSIREKEKLSRGEHIFQSPGFHERRIASQKSKGTLGFCNPTFQKEMGKRAWTNMPKVTCPHCGKMGAKPVMSKYHFDKCKLLLQHSD